MTTQEQATAHSDTSVVVTRTFDAPREAVWRAWTEPELWSQWFAPEPMTGRAEIDLRPEGRYTFTMIDADGTEYTSAGRYLEIEAPERLVYTDEVTDPSDFVDMVNDARGAALGTPVPEGIATVTLRDLGGRTEMTFAEEFDSKGTRDAWVQLQMIEGLDAGFAKLERMLTAVAAGPSN